MLTKKYEAYLFVFNVALAVDAMTDQSAQAHDYSNKFIFPRLGEAGTSQGIVGLLEGSSAA